MEALPTVTNWSWLPWVLPGFSIESPTSWKPPQCSPKQTGMVGYLTGRPIIQVRDGGASSKVIVIKKSSESGYVMKAKPKDFANGVNVVVRE